MSVKNRRFAVLICCFIFGLSSSLAEIKGTKISNESNEIQKTSSIVDDAFVAQNISVPDISLVRQDGKKALLPQEFDQGKPVLLTFIFTSCKAVCPIMSHLMKSVQNKLGKRANEIQMASISLDPEYDTPERLTQYSQKMGAERQWIHYTGLVDDVVKLERAFGIYRGDKMNHLSVLFIRRSPKESWLKFTGFVESDKLIKELGLEVETDYTNH